MHWSFSSSRLTRVLFVAVLGVPVLVSASGSTCYWQNSTAATASEDIAPNDVPCFPDQENSPCCAAGWTCQSDGVCKVSQTSDGTTNDYYYRGTCTDPTWSSPQCPGWCFAQNGNTSWPLAKCDESSGADWYCCDGDTSCDCGTGIDVVRLGDTQPYTVTVIGSTTWPGYTSTTAGFSVASFSEATSSTPTSTSASSTSFTSASTSAAHSISTALSKSTGTAAGAAATSSAAVSSSSSSSHTGLAAGLGAGLGVALFAILAALTYFLIRRHRKNKTPGTPDSDSKPLPPYSEMQGSDSSSYGQDAEALKRQNLYHQNSGHGTELAGQGEYARNEMVGDMPVRQEMESGVPPKYAGGQPGQAPVEMGP